eukprot:6982038-Heterocapsa_arctica.AAC.1
MDSTCSTGNTLDWYIVSGGLAIAAETRVDEDTRIFLTTLFSSKWGETQRGYGSQNQKTQCLP